ncbi:hypothetical protein CC1G_07328 [Coprinopsis cinerea okayama7|uniref:G-protein coupled receptors family 1 profile domain-containing protein n=1 Tax=Coprinopsis cinerea (strain Okayama-7 / 130 / ATCC MYA-4618 / FGSC 9003) TaxID=240176 RepID=A8NNS0_COPC7|nr:hypothetical protein CC1G_07328 [Coprinopsis cinerea okayama7\|eukprot:XP_001835186.2 hypothetical protein CC1G_07328 [Coprinopsis cinerea okayama7\
MPEVPFFSMALPINYGSKEKHSANMPISHSPGYAGRTGGLVQMVLSMITWGAMQAIMINRLWCMYRRSKAILTLLSLALLAETICSSIIVALNYEVANVVVEWSPNFVMCVPTGFASSFYLFWIFILVFDILIFMLALLEGLKYFREVARQRELHDSGQLVTFGSVLWGPREGTLLRVLLRDSILFPFL